MGRAIEIGSKESLNYPQTNEMYIHNSHYTHLKQSQYFLEITTTWRPKKVSSYDEFKLKR